MSLTTTPTADPGTAPALSELDEAEVVAQATGVLMVQYQLTHEQARTALCTRAGNAGHGLRPEAEAIIAAQDAAARDWCAGPAGGVLDGRQLTAR